MQDVGMTSNVKVTVIKVLDVTKGEVHTEMTCKSLQ